MRHLSTLLVWVAVSGYAFCAQANSLDFEDRPPGNDRSATLSEEYAHLGVHFISSDEGAIWGGMSAGDVGGWQIDGTSGSAFLGFDGDSYDVLLSFDAPVSNFQLDASRAQGVAFPFVDSLLVAGFLNGRFTKAVEMYLGDVNRWTTLALEGEVDLVFIHGSGIRGMRFGIDNLSWNGGAASILPAEIDIRPGSEENPVQPSNRGVIPVLTYGSAELDVEQIDPTTIGFGPDGAGVAHGRSGPHYFDADGDGWLDMLTHHRNRETGLSDDDFEACRFAETYDGAALEGCDGVTPVPR